MSTTDKKSAKPQKSLYRQRFEDRYKAIQGFQTKHNKIRTSSERIVDKIVTAAGTIQFLIANAIWFLLWILWNTGTIPGLTIIDPFPFVLLTTAVSLEAIFLSILVLISQNRQARIADLREEVHLQINMISEEEITKVMHILAHIMKALKIETKDPELKEMMQPIDTEEIENRLMAEMESHP